MSIWQQRADIGDAEACEVMMPGAVPLDAPALDIEAEMLLLNRMARLQRVVTTPGSNDRAFLRDIRGRGPSRLSPKEMAHVERLAWRYRFQLPPVLRPAADPDRKVLS